MARKVGGRYSIAVDSEIIPLEGEATINQGFDENEPIVGPRGLEGYAANPQAPMISFSAVYTQDLDLKRIANITNAEVSIELPNGKVGVLREAFAVGNWEIGTARGSVAAGFAGVSYEEVGA